MKYLGCKSRKGLFIKPVHINNPTLLLQELHSAFVSVGFLIKEAKSLFLTIKDLNNLKEWDDHLLFRSSFAVSNIKCDLSCSLSQTSNIINMFINIICSRVMFNLVFSNLSNSSIFNLN